MFPKVTPAQPGELERLRELLQTATPEQRDTVARMIVCLWPVAEIVAYLERQQ
jgi:hypothetical protein